MSELNKKPRPGRSFEQAQERRKIRGPIAILAANEATKKANRDIRKDGFSVSESKRGCLIWAPGREIIGSIELKDQAEMIVAALNGGDVTALRRWRRSPDGKKVHSRLREEVDLRLAA
jgi:hypothetical protein